MERVLTLHRTNIGKKAILAVSGAILVGFLVAHLLGNLQVFLGPEVINEYAASLRRTPAVLWLLRIGLLVAAGAHVWAAFSILDRNAKARTSRYHQSSYRVTSYAARTMRWSGPIALLYIVYHLLHLTFGLTGSWMGYEHDHQNVYNNLVHSFQNPILVLVYVVANAAVGFHLFHGVWSAFQSLGASHPRYDRLRSMLAIGITAFVAGGNVAMPVAIFAGVVEPTTEQFCYPELAREEGECDGWAPSSEGAGRPLAPSGAIRGGPTPRPAASPFAPLRGAPTERVPAEEAE
jgi:succinate dehydrogenase / fumarate reductase cytochrome b subunit